jgi:hypothetical protein
MIVGLYPAVSSLAVKGYDCCFQNRLITVADRRGVSEGIACHNYPAIPRQRWFSAIGYFENHVDGPVAEVIRNSKARLGRIAALKDDLARVGACFRVDPPAVR